MLKLTAAQRAAFRAEAHALHPTVIIGDAGLTPAVLAEINVSLNAHGLVKVRVFSDDRAARKTIYDTICEQLKAAPVQQIGKLLVLYRAPAEPTERPSQRAGKGLREVTIVKPSPSGTRRPTVTKVTLKGNERVTAGGLIKRHKPLQKSAKKSALGHR